MSPSSSEFDYIAWLRGRTPKDAHVLVGPGDDAAVLTPSSDPLVVTTDMLMDGTDFVLAEVGPRRAGRKAMAANLSDIAAMAAEPLAAVAAVALPQRDGRTIAEELYHGLRDAADAFGMPIVGGDTNSWDGPLVISVTVLGRATARGPVLRTGAKPGDWIFVTGPLGGSILGHHLDFTPRIREALSLNAAVELHAMCDISDGLAADLNHILEESRCGAVVRAEDVPVSAAAVELCRQSGKAALSHALGDGEDFELVFTVSAADGAALIARPPVPGLVNIGECIDAGLWLERNGVREPLAPSGWVHDFSASNSFT